MPLSDEQIFDLAAAYERQSQIEGRAKKEKKKVGDQICEELEVRGVKSLTASDGTTVTRTQAESVQFDEKGLWASLRFAVRRKVFRASLPFSKLSEPDQRDLHAWLKERGLTKHLVWSLDTSALTAEVQNGRISSELLAEHSKIVKNAPFPRISHGTGE